MKKDEERTTQTTVVTEETETDGAEQGFTAADERLLRMLHGVPLPPDAPLGNKLDDVAPENRSEVEAKLALIEADLLDAMNVSEDRKSRIVDALRQLPEDD